MMMHLAAHEIRYRVISLVGGQQMNLIAILIGQIIHLICQHPLQAAPDGKRITNVDNLHDFGFTKLSSLSS